jgi:hypothetical protein
VTEPARDWLAAEPGPAEVGRELKRLFRRAWSRPLLPLLLALLGTGLVVGKRARKQRSFTARVVYRVSEDDLDAATAPRPAKRLREHVSEVAFSNARLVEIIKRHGLYAPKLARDPLLAVESFREDIEIDVWRNYFLEERGELDAGRSARIAIGFAHADRELAYQVARALGELLVAHEVQARVAQVAAGLADVEDEARAAKRNLIDRKAWLVGRELLLLRADGPRRVLLAGEIAAEKKRLEALETRLRELDNQKNALTLRLGLEKSQLGLRFELVDEERPTLPRLSRPRELVVAGLLTFLFLLPLAAIGVAARDPRVLDGGDVKRLGLALLGEVGRFPEDNTGALADRLRRERRANMDGHT